MKIMNSFIRYYVVSILPIFNDPPTEKWVKTNMGWEYKHAATYSDVNEAYRYKDGVRSFRDGIYFEVRHCGFAYC